MFSKARLVAPAIAAALTLGAVPAAASAAGTDGTDGWATPTGQRFAAAVLACEESTARGSLGDLRDCVRGLVAPDSSSAEIMDLWRIFMDCLSYMSDAGPDAMYPTSVYEERVNDCLGL